jgi:hypothetical protein
MTEFVAYFSTAQEQLGYVLLDGHMVIETAVMGGPQLSPGIYRVEDGILVQLQGSTTTAR